MDAARFPMDGGCTCRFVRYRMATAPMIVHGCHCRWCQRETGSAFAINAVIEADRVQLLQGAFELLLTPSASGRGQKIARCPHCRVALWSHYPNAGESVCFVRVGTLDTPDALPPQVHIFTASRQPWVVLPPGQLAVPGFYDPARVWSDEARARWRALPGKG